MIKETGEETRYKISQEHLFLAWLHIICKFWQKQDALWEQRSIYSNSSSAAHPSMTITSIVTQRNSSATVTCLWQ